ncbi:unnamed protein product [Plutella xylostella]|uniref:(diamondback moth) hypothetical protein n=1 Tax=Plutella xylostella TaxID=51655 RepID=A0A8S4ER43_PLUXY|nr:unnamed protein product [Plutella xylostella]
MLANVNTHFSGEIILTEDKPYDVIDIKVPVQIWKKAISPTPPILKTQATVVLPVHVESDYNDEDEEPIDEDNLVEEAPSPVDDVMENPPVDTQTVQADVTPAAPVTAAPVQDEISNDPTGVVPGQVTRFPCSCVGGGGCGCCTGMLLQRLRMDACGNITFIPEDFVFDVRLSVNNNTVVHRRVSASDPPPICFNPRRIPFVQVCAEITNIRIRNRNAFACLDINADVGGFPVYSTSFRCFGLGSSGVQTGLKPKKPVSEGPKPVSLFGSSSSGSSSSSGGGVISNAAGAIIGGEGPAGILDGVAEGIFGGDDEGGPLDEIGDAVGEFLEGRSS